MDKVLTATTEKFLRSVPLPEKTSTYTPLSHGAVFDISEEELQQHLIGFLLTVLPEAVKVLQEFGRHMDERGKGELVHNQQARSNKIGRNEPCPCGSGKKYKKCCALTDQDGHLH